MHPPNTDSGGELKRPPNLARTMRAFTISILTTFLVAGLAMPQASASDCLPDTFVGGGIGLYFRDDCSPDPHAEIGTYCLGGGGTTKTIYDRENVTVFVTTCDGNPGGDPGSIAGVGCKPYSHKELGTTVTLGGDCSVLVQNRYYECVWGGSYVTVLQVGPVTVQEYRCTPPGDIE